MADHPEVKPETLTAQAGHWVDPETGGVVPPIQPSTTFARDQAYRLVDGDRAYARDKNPTFEPAEALLAGLEKGKAAKVFASGMAAAVAVLQALEPGDHVVAQKVMYWAVRMWLQETGRRWGLEVDFFDAGDPEDLARVLKPGKTKLVWVETPSNPSWDVVDIAEASRLAHDAGARLLVDSTVVTPVLSQPLTLGADIVFHAATKYLNGHSDVVAGALVTAKEDELWERVCYNRAYNGAILGSFEAWLLLRGMRTLHVRVWRASETALQIARHLDGHPKLIELLYPGLQSHPGHSVAKRQMSGGFGGMLSFRVEGGAEAALAMAGASRLFLSATSLGGVESLIEHRITSEGPGSPVPDDLLRLSVGIEAPEDLIADLDQALDKI